MYSYRFPRDYIFCSIKLGTWNSSWRFYGLPIIKKHRKATIEIGNNFTACSSPYYNSLGVFQKVTIKVLSSESILKVGENVGISGASISCSLSINIGNNVLIGSGAVITDNDAHPINPFRREEASQILKRPVLIEDDVFIGARAMILKGVTVGKGALIGAGAIVTSNVPPYSIAAGNPAKVVGDVRDPKYILG
jgi:acetyltransferase-like isoleucine patch superfamily enzyme